MSFDDCGCEPIEVCGTCTPICSGSHCAPTGWSMYDVSPENCEHKLFQSTLCEVVDISGFVIEYRLLLTKDNYLWGEDPNANLSYPSYTKVIYTPGSDSNLLDLFGLSSDETIQYMFIPKATFSRDLSMLYNDVLGSDIAVRPRVGDVVKTHWNNRNYEVTNVSEDESDIFGAKTFVYAVILRPFRFSEQSPGHREVHTGLPDDPFASIVPGPSGDIIQHDYFVESYGDNKNIDDESDSIYDYDDEGPQGSDDIVDPDESAFGR